MSREHGTLGVTEPSVEPWVPSRPPPESLTPTVQMFNLHHANPCHKKGQLLLLLSDPNSGALTLALPSPRVVPGGDSHGVKLLNRHLVP